MKVHFIAIGGSAMHNLAIALRRKGYDVTGSDDEIFEPAAGRLAKEGLLPEAFGWYSERINRDIDAVILGMHAKGDNPELSKARELGLKIYSYPEYLYEQSRDKVRVVIAGSHGKTTTTAMVLHVLQDCGIETDYMVGAQLEGFDVMVKLTESAPYMVMEGDEYLSSTLDPRPKFHLYRPHIALLSGIAWDHINVFPEFEGYISQFSQFIGLIEPKGALVYFSGDPVVNDLAGKARKDIRLIPYGTLPYRVDAESFILDLPQGRYEVGVFGKHNMQNIHGAWMVCRLMGVTDKDFLDSIPRFRGASRRLQLLGKSGSAAVFKDFAHSPSKLKATIDAVRELYPGRKLVACLELHTYSSLRQDFMEQYRDCMELADVPMVYFNPHALTLKRLQALDPAKIKDAFGHKGLRVFADSAEMESFLESIDYHNSCLLMMSSGDFDGLDLDALTDRILSR